MTYTTLFFQAFIYLLATVIAVPIAKRIGLGSVLGYLLAGIIIGPYMLGLVSGGDNVMHFAEFGVVMMLFLIGLELRPAMLWQMKRQLFLTGGLQVAVTAVIIAIIAFLFGLPLNQAVTVGIIFTSSSTAIVLQLLHEKNWIKLDAGSTIFAILLFQDIAVIPILALFPLLGNHSNNIEHSQLLAWQQTVLTIGLIIVVILSGKYLVRPVFRFIAASQLHEAFTALALLLVIGIALAMQYVGLSPALGAFLAGVVLAESEYRHELEADIEPFKGILLGLFFISVGGGIDFPLIGAHWLMIIGLVVLLVAIKFIVLFILGLIFKRNLGSNLMISMTLAQGGEFCFVLLAYALKEQILNVVLVRELIAVVSLSMLLTPLIMLFYQKGLEPKFVAKEEEDRKPDVVLQNNPVLIAGFGRFGQIVGRFMLANGVNTTVLDIDPNQVDVVRKFGFKVFYGDASRIEILNQAGIMYAKVLVLAMDNTETALKIVQMVRHIYPDLKILIRVHNRTNVYEALNLDIDLHNIYRETFDTALHVGVNVLSELGIDPERAKCSAKRFKKIDNEQLVTMSTIYDGKLGADYINKAQQHTRELENILISDTSITGENK